MGTTIAEAKPEQNQDLRALEGAMLMDVANYTYVITSHDPENSAATMQNIVEDFIERGVFAQLQKRQKSSSVKTQTPRGHGAETEVNK